MKQLLKMGARAGAVAAGAYAGYAALRWLSYGKPPKEGADTLLNEFMPEYEGVERHDIRVAAPASVTLAAAREVDFGASPVARTLFAIREIPSRLRGHAAAPPPERRGMIEQMTALGWTVLSDVPDREIVLGTVTQPWLANVEFRAVPASQFASFAEPGFVKIAMCLAADPLGPAECLFRMETRVAATDAEARRRFRRYWALVGAGIVLIRYESLRLVKAAAEGRAAVSAAVA